MKKAIFVLLMFTLFVSTSAGFAENETFNYRFADAEEAAELLLSNRNYYDNLSQNDLNFRMQKLDATLAELESYTAEQTLDWTDGDKTAVNSAMAAIEMICEERGYTLPVTEGIVFAKTTMHEECDASAYTHGTQIYLGENLLRAGQSENIAYQQYFQEVAAHELFHCLTRNHPEFREAMYSVLGFTVAEEDYDFPQKIDDIIISNPDVGHHNSFASFEIDGEMKDCTVIFTTSKPFEQPGDNFFHGMMTGLVPVDNLSVMYTAEETANFWDVFGKNTGYVIDPEETMADNFSYTIIYGLERDYETPEIIQAIDAYLKGEKTQRSGYSEKEKTALNYLSSELEKTADHLMRDGEDVEDIYSTLEWSSIADTFPEKFDLRERGTVTPVKDQSPWGTC
ncbi:MAG: hypothetical protein IJI14_01340 [Anaerolineaceae bacterium]|nr:hypothetical protein [Anaerolineaceae bacterium]